MEVMLRSLGGSSVGCDLRRSGDHFHRPVNFPANQVCEEEVEGEKRGPGVVEESL